MAKLFKKTENILKGCIKFTENMDVVCDSCLKINKETEQCATSIGKVLLQNIYNSLMYYLFFLLTAWYGQIVF